MREQRSLPSGLCGCFKPSQSPLKRKSWENSFCVAVHRSRQITALYDAVLNKVQGLGDLVILPSVPKEKAYLETNHRIISEALILSRTLQNPVVAVRVWEGKSRGKGDITEEFGHHAQMQGLRVYEVMTH